MCLEHWADLIGEYNLEMDAKFIDKVGAEVCCASLGVQFVSFWLVKLTPPTVNNWVQFVFRLVSRSLGFIIIFFRFKGTK